jgi:hypothetical protein
MEFIDIQKKLNATGKNFLTSLSDYLETPFFYFGSIARPDFVPGASDVDIDVFTDNEVSTVSQLLNFLKLSRKNVQNVVWILDDDTTTYGHKIKHQLDKNNMFEYSIYNTQFKDKILAEHRGKMVLPIYNSICLFILKLLYYRLHVISDNTYISTKRYILSSGIGKDKDRFFVYDP